MFSQPLLGELIGAGFTKDLGAMVDLYTCLYEPGEMLIIFKHYSLRFPRLTKVWRTTERNWTEGMVVVLPMNYLS